MTEYLVGAFVAFRPVLELDDECAVGCALTGDEAVAVNHCARLYFGNESQNRVYFVEGSAGAFLRCARRHVYHNEQCAGVFVGHKSGRGNVHEPYEEGYGAAYESHAYPFEADKPFGADVVFAEHFVVGVVERCVESGTEQSEHGEHTHYHGYCAECDVFKVVPAENHECDGCHEHEECEHRVECYLQAESLLVLFLDR